MSQEEGVVYKPLEPWMYCGPNLVSDKQSFIERSSLVPYEAPHILYVVSRDHRTLGRRTLSQ